jgi:hypothetical protein
MLIVEWVKKRLGIKIEEIEKLGRERMKRGKWEKTKSRNNSVKAGRAKNDKSNGIK